VTNGELATAFGRIDVLLPVYSVGAADGGQPVCGDLVVERAT